MPQLICVVSQRSAVAIRRLDDDALAGNFGGVDWRGLGAIAEGIATALGKTQVLARSEIEMVQTLHPDGRWCTINNFLYNKCLVSGISA